MIKKLISLAMICIMLVVGLVVFAAEPVELKLSNVQIKGNYIIGAKYDRVSLENVKLDGYITFDGTENREVHVAISENSVIGGLICNRPVALENKGHLKAIKADASVQIVEQGTIDAAILKSDVEIKDDGKVVIIKNGQAINGVGLIAFLGDEYYVGAEGKLAQGIVFVEGMQYFFGTDYVRKTGFVEYEGNTYYFRPNGTMAKGLTTLGNNQYYFDDLGVMQKGFVEIDGGTYYFTEKGVRKTKMIEHDGVTRFLYEDGTTAKGLTAIDGKKYYFNDQGIMQKGNVTIDGKKYYFHENGVMAVNEKVGNYRADYDGTLNYILMDNAALDAEIGAILSRITNDGMSERDKMLAVYKWMQANIEWRGIAVDISGGYTDPLLVELAVYALNSRKGSCEHYAALETVLIRRLGYKTITTAGSRLSNVSGKWGEHSWLRVSVDGVYYHFDPQYAASQTKNNVLSAFLASDEAFKAHHRW